MHLYLSILSSIRMSTSDTVSLALETYCIETPLRVQLLVGRLGTRIRGMFKLVNGLRQLCARSHLLESGPQKDGEWVTVPRCALKIPVRCGITDAPSRLPARSR